LSVKRVNLKPIWNPRAQLCGVDRPVRKEQVVPALRHHPRSWGQRPRPVPDCLQGRVHVYTQRLLDKVIF
jgi:hypothetical protein